MTRFVIIAAAVMAIAVAVALVLLALPARGPRFLAAGADMAPPDGFVAMCHVRADLCQPQLSTGAPPHDLRAALDRVNKAVNTRVAQRPDPDGDQWGPATSEGDCEDLAIAKRIDLVAQGFPPDRLFYAVAWLTEDGRHAVLIARLDDGDVILDNRFDYLLPVARAKWRWISVQSAAEPLVWFEVAA